MSEQRDIVPAQVRVLAHVRFQYACRAGEETIKTAPLAPQPLPNSNASPGLLAHIAVAKYADALPLARQERILTRRGVDLPRATLAGWMIKRGVLLAPLIAPRRAHRLADDIVQMDETRVPVLTEDGRDPSRHSFRWVQRGHGTDASEDLPRREVAMAHHCAATSQKTDWRTARQHLGHFHRHRPLHQVPCPAPEQLLQG